MGEIIGRTTCPVCGAPNQNLKINKNGNLYMYCDNRCSTRFNPQESRELIDALRAGRTVKRGVGFVVPVGTSAAAPIEVKNITKPVKKTTEVKKDDGKQQRGNPTDGRGNGESAGCAGAGQPQRPVERFTAWLWGDDDI